MTIPSLEAQVMMEMFVERQPKVGFLTSFFKPTARSTGTTAKFILWDAVRRSVRRAAVVSPGTGVRLHTADDFTTKQIEPPRYAQGVAVDVNELVNRVAGEDPWSAANRSIMSRFIIKVNDGLIQSALMIDRSMEDQAAQILQTGELSLVGEVPFVEDFFPKSTHFPTVGTAWSDTAALALDDIESLCDVIQTDSHATITNIFLGRTALRELLNTDQFKEQANLRRVNLIDIDPGRKDRGATRYGVITVGQFELTMWAYNEKSEPVGGGTRVPYIDVGKVILLPDDPDLVVGSVIVPRLLGPDPRLSGFISQPTKSEGGWDLVPNLFADDSGDVITAAMYAGAVLIPTGIDQFGALTT